MKKLILKVSCLLMVCLMLLSSGVFAANLNVSASKTTVEQGQSFTISVNSGAKLTDFEVAASTGSLSLPSVTSKYSGSTTSTSGTKSIVKLFQISAQADKTVIGAGTNLATFKYEVPKTQAAGSITITVTLKGVDSTGGKITATATKTINVVKAKSTNSNLSDLKVDGTTVASFNKNTTSYNLGTVETTKTSINITATAEDKAATVSGTGTKTLKEGKNTFTVKVTAENGSVKSYTIVVTRKVSPKSTNNLLSSLKVDGTTVKGFNKNTTSYNLGEVANTKTSIKIAATAADSKAKVVGAGTKTLKEGKNTFTVKVTAENGSTKSYTLTITRTPAPKSTNNNLSDLKVDGATVANFNKNTTSYNLGEVETTKTSIKIAATAEDKAATVSGTGTKTLKEGKNTFTVKVTAENGSVKSYTIVVTRKVSPKSTNNLLSSLKVDGTTVKGFNKNTTSYNLGEVANTKTSIKIAATAADSKAKVVGAGTKTLKEGKNTFTVKVTAENGNVKSYTLVITRKAKAVEVVKSSNANLMGITINGVSIENFVATTNTYSYKVSADTETIDVVATAEDTKATVKVNKPDALAEGTNVVKVTVTAENGTVKEYTVNVEKEKAQDVPAVSDKPTVEEPTVQEPTVEKPVVEEQAKEMDMTIILSILVGAVVLLLIIVLIVKAAQSRRK